MSTIIGPDGVAVQKAAVCRALVVGKVRRYQSAGWFEARIDGSAFRCQLADGHTPPCVHLRPDGVHLAWSLTTPVRMLPPGQTHAQPGPPPLAAPATRGGDSGGGVPLDNREAEVRSYGAGALGFSGEVCKACQSVQTVRTGTCVRCLACNSAGGCG